jgi:hypothetical protein
MRVPEAFRFAIRGFSPKRMAYALSAMSLVLVPVHSYVACEVSGGIGGIGMMLAFGSGLLCWLIPKDAPHRLRPVAFALCVFLGHMVSIH